LAAYSQESTRYVGYNDDLTFIAPVDYSHYIEEKDVKYTQEDIDKIEDEEYKVFLQSLYNIEQSYFNFKNINKKRDLNRDLLPLALKT
jgi:thymidylate synthase ThyX